MNQQRQQIAPPVGSGTVAAAYRRALHPLMLVLVWLLLERIAEAVAQDYEQRQALMQQPEAPQSICHPDWQWMCDDGLQCIAQYDVCDGIAQCVDHSDEKNCGSRNRLSSHREGDHRSPAHPITSASLHPTTQRSASTPSGKHEGSAERRIPMEHMLAGLTAFAIVAGLVHWALRIRRRRRAPAGVRGFRKGESLVEDEDDLLISQMYT